MPLNFTSLSFLNYTSLPFVRPTAETQIFAIHIEFDGFGGCKNQGARADKEEGVFNGELIQTMKRFNIGWYMFNVLMERPGASSEETVETTANVFKPLNKKVTQSSPLRLSG